MKEETISLGQYIDSLQSRGVYWFLRQDAIQVLQLSSDAFKMAAHRLMKKGRLQRVRGEFYVLVPLEYQAINSLPATWFIDALMQHLHQKYYVGLLSAAALHGAAHQQPMTFQVITDKRTRMITAGQVRIQFLYKKSISNHFFQKMKTDTGTMNVATPEMTAFDLVRYMDVSGQVNHVATVLCELAEKLNAEKLAKLLEEGEVEISIAQRLGYLLETLALPVDLTFLENVLKNKKTIKRWLITKGERNIISHNKKWHILVNEILEPDDL
jgi:predicted transcriptional regulator of viral defense system